MNPLKLFDEDNQIKQLNCILESFCDKFDKLTFADQMAEVKTFALYLMNTKYLEHHFITYYERLLNILKNKYSIFTNKHNVSVVEKHSLAKYRVFVYDIYKSKIYPVAVYTKNSIREVKEITRLPLFMYLVEKL